MFVDETLLMIEGSFNDDELPLYALPAAIPYFRITIEAICIERRELGVIKEFILRSIACGMATLDEIQGLLGLSENVVASAIEGLERYYYITPNGESSYRLLDRGIQALSNEGILRPIITNLELYIHGLSRSIQGQPRNYIHPVNLIKDTLTVPATPIRPPNEGEIDLAQLHNVISNLRTKRPQLYDISRLGRILQTRRVFSVARLFIPREHTRKHLVYADRRIDHELSDMLMTSKFIDTLSSALESALRQTHRILRKSIPKLEGAPLMPSTQIFPLLCLIVQSHNLRSAEKKELKGKVSEEAKKALSQNFWIGQIDAQVLFHVALMTARKRLVIQTPVWPIPHLSDCIEEQLQTLTHLHGKIELWLPKSLIDVMPVKYARRFNMQPIVGEGKIYGFLWDDKHAVMGCTQTLKAGQHTTDVFLGALYSGDDTVKTFQKALSIN